MLRFKGEALLVVARKRLTRILKVLGMNTYSPEQSGHSRGAEKLYNAI
jgi:hypothetical protein